MRTTIQACFIGFLTLLASSAGCGRSQENGADDQSAALEHKDITPDELQRMIAASLELRNSAMAMVQPAEFDRIIKAHGFGDRIEFEQLRGRVGLAMQRVRLGPEGGFGDVGRQGRLEDKILALEKQQRDNETNPALSQADRNLRAVDIKRRIEEMRDQIKENEAIAQSVERQLAGISEQSMMLISSRFEELMTIFSPSFVATPPPQELPFPTPENPGPK